MTTLRVRELDHIVLNVQDIDASLRFYTEFLGLEALRLNEFRGGTVRFPSVRISAGTIIDLFPPAMHGQSERSTIRNVNHFCVVVEEDIEQIEEHVRSWGIPIKSGPDEVFGARGIGVSMYCWDPDENVVEIRSYPLPTKSSVSGNGR